MFSDRKYITNVSHGKLHKCVFIIKKQELTLHNFFETEKTNKPENEFSEEGVKQRLAILAGKKTYQLKSWHRMKFIILFNTVFRTEFTFRIRTGQ